MKRLIRKGGMIILTTLLLASCTISAEQAIDSQQAVVKIPQKVLLREIDQASDPGNIAATVKTQFIQMTAKMPMTKVEFSQIMLIKQPDKVKIISIVPGIMTENVVFDGVNGWKSNSRMGVEKITGMALNQLKYNALSASSLKFADRYERIELSPKLVKVADWECYKLTCYPPEKLKLKPQTVYVERKTFLIRRTVSTVFTMLGEVKAETTFLRYKKINGLVVPVEISSEQLGMNITMKLVKFIVNLPLPDSAFSKPQPGEADSNGSGNNKSAKPSTGAAHVDVP